MTTVLAGFILRLMPSASISLRARRQVFLCVALLSLALYLGLHLYAQYRHVDIYVSRVAPMPGELAQGLHLEEHKIEPLVSIESPYETSEDKKLSWDEIQRLRSQIAWSKAMPVLIDSLTILSPVRVLARRTTSRAMLEYHLVRRGDRWLIESATRSEIQRPPR